MKLDSRKYEQTSMLRVLHVLPELTSGGAAGLVANVSVEWVNKGEEIHVFLLHGVIDQRGQYLAERMERAGIVLHGMEKRYRSYLHSIKEIFEVVRTTHPDVILSHICVCVILCAIVKWFLPWRKTKYLQFIHSTGFYENKYTRLHRFVSRWLIDGTIACSEIAKTSFCRFLGDENAKNVYVVRNGVVMTDIVVSDETRRRARNRLEISQESFLVTNIGGYYPVDKEDATLSCEPKAHDTILRSFAHAFRDDPNARLVLLGKGPLKSVAEEMAKDLGIRDRVIFMEVLDEPWELLMATDVFLFPSRFEGMPAVIIEAASIGLPVVTTNIPEIKDLCLDETAWIMTDVDDSEKISQALKTVRENLLKYKEYAKKVAWRYKNEYAMSDMVDRLQKVCLSILR
jgi:glycosyltransferase involved in cell wall biosynthesis